MRFRVERVWKRQGLEDHEKLAVRLDEAEERRCGGAAGDVDQASGGRFSGLGFRV